MSDTPAANGPHFLSKPFRLGLLICMALIGTGCADRSAPAIVLFGAYFPDWLLFALAAIAAAISARVVAGLIGLERSIPFPLFTYLATGVLVSGFIYLAWMGR